MSSTIRLPTCLWIATSIIILIGSMVNVYLIITASVVGFNINTPLSNTWKVPAVAWPVTSELIPSQFSQSLFCPIRHRADKAKYKLLLHDLYELQFNTSCDYNERSKFLIFDDHNQQWGLFSAWDNHHVPMLTLAVGTKRTFLLRMVRGRNYAHLLHSNGKHLSEQCQHRTGRECYFKPTSNCDNNQIDRILADASEHDDVLVINQEMCELLANHSIDTLERFSEFSQRYSVLHYQKSFKSQCAIFRKQKSMNRELTEHIIEKHQYGKVSYHEFNALMISFVLRLQDNIRAVIEQQMIRSLHKYNFSSSLSTVSMAIRASDKCNQNGRRGEMRCRSLEDHLNATYKLKQAFNPDIDAVIVTSEDKHVIERCKEIMHNYPDLKFIFNDFDVMQSSGNPVELKRGRFFNDQTSDIKSDNDWVLYQMFMSALTSFRLQMNAYYAVTESRSNWVHAVWRMSRSIHCEIDVDVEKAAEKKHCIDFNKTGFLGNFDEHCLRNDRTPWHYK